MQGKWFCTIAPSSVAQEEFRCDVGAIWHLEVHCMTDGRVVLKDHDAAAPPKRHHSPQCSDSTTKCFSYGTMLGKSHRRSRWHRAILGHRSLEQCFPSWPDWLLAYLTTSSATPNSTIQLWGRSGRGCCRTLSANFRRLSAEFLHLFPDEIKCMCLCVCVCVFGKFPQTFRRISVKKNPLLTTP